MHLRTCRKRRTSPPRKLQISLQNAILKLVANSEREVTLCNSLHLKKFQDKKKIDAVEKGALRLGKTLAKNGQSLQEFEEMME